MAQPKLPHRYGPREYQAPFWRAMLSEKKKRAVLVWHRRAGKDTTAWNFMILEAVTRRPGVYYYFFPTYAQGKKILWDGLNHEGMPFLHHLPEDLILHRNETEMKLVVKSVNWEKTRASSILQVIGSDNYDSVARGTNPVGVVLSEYAYQDPRAYDVLAPVLRENGGWAVFVYTPNGLNHGNKLYELAKKNPDEFFCERLTVDDTTRADGTPVIAPDQIEAERREGRDEETIQQEYYCSFQGGIQGAYYAREVRAIHAEGRLCDLAWDPLMPVTTGWDLGVNDANAIWFVQARPDGWVHVLDYLEGVSEGLPHYAKEIRQNRPYLYAEHLTPFDMEVRDYSLGISRKQAAERFGVRPIRVIPRTALQEQVSAVRMLLPRCKFDRKCEERGLAALAQYSREWDDEMKVFRKQPKHDWASHGAAAFATLALGLRTPADPAQVTKVESLFDPLGDWTRERWLHGPGQVESEFNPLEVA